MFTAGVIEEQDGLCPHDGAPVTRTDRYPVALCPECMRRATDAGGRPVRLSNGALSGGFQVVHVDDGSRCDQVERDGAVLVDGAPYVAAEARFGGVVVYAPGRDRTSPDSKASRARLDPRDLHVARLLALRRTVLWAIPASGFAVVGALLLPERELLPVAIGLIFLATAASMLWAGLGTLRDVRRLDRVETRRLRAERVVERVLPSWLQGRVTIQYRLLDRSTLVGTLHSVIPPRLDGPVRMITGKGECALLVEAQGRRRLIYLP